jgi:cbb3-type cytochrome oxidase subunit 3
MRLSDVVSHSATSTLFAQIALVIAILGFIGVVAYVVTRRNRKTFERARLMPLDDETVQTPRGAAPEQLAEDETGQAPRGAAGDEPSEEASEQAGSSGH